MTYDEKYPFSPYAVIKNEANRIITELMKMTTPNSSDGAHYNVRIDDTVWALMTSSQRDIFYSFLDFQFSIFKPTYSDGYYVSVYWEGYGKIHHKIPLRVHPKRVTNNTKNKERKSTNHV